MVDCDIILILCPSNVMVLTRPTLQEMKKPAPLVSSKTRRNLLSADTTNTDINTNTNTESPKAKPKLSDNQFY